MIALFIVLLGAIPILAIVLWKYTCSMFPVERKVVMPPNYVGAFPMTPGYPTPAFPIHKQGDRYYTFYEKENGTAKKEYLNIVDFSKIVKPKVDTFNDYLEADFTKHVMIMLNEDSAYITNIGAQHILFEDKIFPTGKKPPE